MQHSYSINFIKTIVMASLLTLFGCRNSPTPQNSESTIPTYLQIESLKQTETKGLPINNEDSLFQKLTQYSVVGFGHNHRTLGNYLAFLPMIPKLRSCNFLLLAVELPTSLQPLLDSIMNEHTPPNETTRLLDELHTEIKTIDAHLRIGNEQMHPLFKIILSWLQSGGIIVAVDVPFKRDKESKKILYNETLFHNSISEQSASLLNRIKHYKLNDIDDEKEINLISELRSAYMASLLNYYRQKNAKIACFLGAYHLLKSCASISPVSISIPALAKEYFQFDMFTFWPCFNTSEGFYQTNSVLGDAAYGVPAPLVTAQDK